MAAPTPEPQTTDRSEKTKEPPAAGPTAPSAGGDDYEAKASNPGQRKPSSDSTSNNKKGGYGAG